MATESGGEEGHCWHHPCHEYCHHFLLNEARQMAEMVRKVEASAVVAVVVAAAAATAVSVAAAAAAAAAHFQFVLLPLCEHYSDQGAEGFA